MYICIYQSLWQSLLMVCHSYSERNMKKNIMIASLWQWLYINLQKKKERRHIICPFVCSTNQLNKWFNNSLAKSVNCIVTEGISIWINHLNECFNNPLTVSQLFSCLINQHFFFSEWIIWMNILITRSQTINCLVPEWFSIFWTNRLMSH